MRRPYDITNIMTLYMLVTTIIVNNNITMHFIIYLTVILISYIQSFKAILFHLRDDYIFAIAMPLNVCFNYVKKISPPPP